MDNRPSFKATGLLKDQLTTMGFPTTIPLPTEYAYCSVCGAPLVLAHYKMENRGYSTSTGGILLHMDVNVKCPLGHNVGGMYQIRTDPDGSKRWIGYGLPHCYIATATYGTPMHADIQRLRDWRDNTLKRNPVGRAFVRFYYATSPPIADFIRPRNWLRAIFRAIIGVIFKAIPRGEAK